ncbi:MAG: hypothetical protein HY800_02850 [Ignavibacteriales bacterium]|nr:hypothetical protein [Ignavibacteriales bacterium]
MELSFLFSAFSGMCVFCKSVRREPWFYELDAAYRLFVAVTTNAGDFYHGRYNWYISRCLKRANTAINVVSKTIPEGFSNGVLLF